MIKDYYSLTKSGLIYGNLITVIGGFALGAAVAGDGINIILLVATLVGISFVMASGCVFNNIIDRDIDAKMDRTKDRALVTEKISESAATNFAIGLGLFGFFVLAVFANFLTLCVGLFGFFAYVFLYSLWTKRRSVHGALVGSISGATPPVVGYAAATGHLDVAALLLFLILVFWQMPHFYAIAIRRAHDYAQGGVPVLPLKRGIHATKIAMLVYIIGFIIAASLLTILDYTGYAYLAIVLLLGLGWLMLCLKGFKVPDYAGEANQRWARTMFFFSLIVIVTLFATITIGAII